MGLPVQACGLGSPPLAQLLSGLPPRLLCLWPRSCSSCFLVTSGSVFSPRLCLPLYLHTSALVLPACLSVPPSLAGSFSLSLVVCLRLWLVAHHTLSLAICLPACLSLSLLKPESLGLSTFQDWPRFPIMVTSRLDLLVSAPAKFITFLCLS